MEDTEHDLDLDSKIDVIGIVDRIDSLKCFVGVLDSLLTRFPDKEVGNWVIITEALSEKIAELEQDFDLLRRRISSQK